MGSITSAIEAIKNRKRLPPVQQVASVEVSNPKHYADPTDNFQEPIDRIRNVGFNFGSSDKYLSRLGKKGGDNTEARDAGAVIWYCLDLMAHLLTKDESDYVPSFAAIREFEVKDYINNVLQQATSYEIKTGLQYAEDPAKRYVLAAMHRSIRIYDDASMIGMSDRQYREFVLESLVAAYQVINFASFYVSADKPVFSFYKGSKSAPLTPELARLVKSTYNAIHNVMNQPAA